MDKKNIDSELDKALKADFEFNLPDNFTDQVLSKVQQAGSAAAPQTDRNLYWLLFAAGGLMIAACLITVTLYTDIKVVEYITQYGGYLLFVLGLVAIVQFLDNKLVKEKLGVSKLG